MTHRSKGGNKQWITTENDCNPMDCQIKRSPQNRELVLSFTFYSFEKYYERFFFSNVNKNHRIHLRNQWFCKNARLRLRICNFDQVILHKMRDEIEETESGIQKNFNWLVKFNWNSMNFPDSSSWNLQQIYFQTKTYSNFHWIPNNFD